MKKNISLFVIMSALAFAAAAQQPRMSVYGGQGQLNTSKFSRFMSKLQYSFDLYGGVGIDTRSKSDFGLNFHVTYPFSDTLSVGIGVGGRGVMGLNAVSLDMQSSVATDGYSQNWLLPITARVKYSPYRFGLWTPFISLDLGGSVPLAGSSMGGLFFEPMLGTNLKVSQQASLFFALGLSWVQTKYQYVNYWYTTTQTIGSSATALSLHAGITF